MSIYLTSGSGGRAGGFYLRVLNEALISIFISGNFRKRNYSAYDNRYTINRCIGVLHTKRYWNKQGKHERKTTLTTERA